MRTRSTTALLAVLAALAAGACAPISAAPRLGDIATDYCAPLAHLVCSRAAECACHVADPAGCEANAMAGCLRANRIPIAAGERLVLANWQACFARIQALDPCAAMDEVFCDAIVTLDPGPNLCIERTPCAGEGTLCLDQHCAMLPGEGDPCTRDCAPGLACAASTTTCVRRPGLGGTCFTEGDCLEGRCVAGVCALSIAVGGACTSTDACRAGLACIGGVCAAPTGPCSSDADCGQGARCDPPRTCQPPLALGEPCAPLSSACGATAWCDAGSCARLPSAGEACTFEQRCAPGASCVGGTCMGELARGQACSATTAGCAVGLACVLGVCGDPPREGGDCSVDGRCASGTRCDTTHCVPLATEGERCMIYSACAPGLQCAPVHVADDNVCVRAPTLGQVCIPGDPCPCLPDASGVPVCGAPPTLGDPCDDLGAACNTGLVCRASGPGACVMPICDDLLHY